MNAVRIVYMTTGTCKLLLDRQLVARFDGVWHWKDLMVWRRCATPPKIDLDMTHRWFAYSRETMVKAKAELRA